MADGLGPYLEDIVIGAAITTASTVITADDVTRFAVSYDPQPMHLDPAAATSSIFGRIVASGWQTLALTMRLMVEARPFDHSPLVGVAVDEVRFKAPVEPGATIRAAAVITGIRRRGNSTGGFVTLEVTTDDISNGRVVLSQKWTLLLPTRPDARTDSQPPVTLT